MGEVNGALLVVGGGVPFRLFLEVGSICDAYVQDGIFLLCCLCGHQGTHLTCE